MYGKKLTGRLLIVILLFALSCAAFGAAKDIVVLFTNDTHCGITDGMGFAGLAAYRDYVASQKNTYVTLVDCGDAVQGDVIGSVSKGHAIIELMNACGYEYAVLGNHEFDYGMIILDQLMDEAKAQYIGCNITYTGSGENMLDGLKPYVIKKYGSVKVAFIGATTPGSIASSTPVYFMEGDRFVYDFKAGNGGRDLYDCIQANVDKARKEGAKYCVLLSHLGDTQDCSPHTSVEVIQNTTGLDAVLDGHSHSVIPCRVIPDKSGKNVLLCSTGTRFANLGRLTITAAGNVSVGLISDYRDKSSSVLAAVDKVKADNDKLLGQPVAVISEALSDSDAAGHRLVRCRETGLGNLIADSSRDHFGADIALMNGGGIRKSLPQGQVTYGSILAVMPFGNTHCMIKATGQQILDALEMTSMFTQKEYFDGKDITGEFGAFLNPSGLKYTIDTSVPSSVKTDSNGMFAGVQGPRRVKDVMVENNGQWAPIDPAASYKVAGTSYTLLESGDGVSVFADCERLADDGILDVEILIEFIKKQDGKLDRYYKPEGRITVE
ncbi:MAG: bifunctional metallophosphatase/5'-nucleotidase [Abditibacteriota bacterium]|nr:bifunctional metallophosphatase/5'-nucleotidase [Abditibacteriota bacterium]